MFFFKTQIRKIFQFFFYFFIKNKLMKFFSSLEFNENSITLISFGGFAHTLTTHDNFRKFYKEKKK
jgi:hypothetical protein